MSGMRAALEADDEEMPKPRILDAPKRIFMNYGDIERDATHDECVRLGDVTWCEDPIFDSDVEYVRADLAATQQPADDLIPLRRENGELSGVFIAKPAPSAPAQPSAPVEAADEEQPIETRKFYAAYYEHERLTGHKPSHLDVWLLARGVMTTDGRTAPPSVPVPATPSAGVLTDERAEHFLSVYQNDRRVVGDHAAFLGVAQDIADEVLATHPTSAAAWGEALVDAIVTELEPLVELKGQSWKLASEHLVEIIATTTGGKA